MDTGQPIDAITLDRTAAALINVTGSLTGRFGLAGLEQGTGQRRGVPGWITVEWIAGTERNICGEALVGSDLIRLYPNVRGCRCAGNQAAIDMVTVKHELGHVLGYYHTSDRGDLMYGQNQGQCDAQPSAREIYHASLAYGQPNGSLEPR